MEYKGKLYGKVGEIYFEMAHTTDDFDAMVKRITELGALINHPEIEDFIQGMKLEAAHQTERWGLENEEANPPHHYILVGSKLLGKMSTDIFDRNTDKFKHHCIAIAAEMFNIHRQIKKEGTEINNWFFRKNY